MVGGRWSVRLVGLSVLKRRPSIRNPTLRYISSLTRNVVRETHAKPNPTGRLARRCPGPPKPVTPVERERFVEIRAGYHCSRRGRECLVGGAEIQEFSASISHRRGGGVLRAAREGSATGARGARNERADLERPSGKIGTAERVCHKAVRHVPLL